MASELGTLKSFLIASVAVNGNKSSEHVTVRSLLDAYKRLFGSPMPLGKLGHTSLESLITNAMSDTFQLYRMGSEQCVRCLVQPAGQNIIEMIRNEKQPKKKKSKNRFRGSCRYREGGGGGSMGGAKKSKKSSQTASQRLSAPPSLPSSHSQSQQPPIGLFNVRHPPVSQRPPPPQDSRSQSSSGIPAEIRARVAELAASHPGFAVANFDNQFLKYFGTRLPFKQLGFANLLSMMQRLESLGDVQLFNMRKDVVVLSPGAMQRSRMSLDDSNKENSLLKNSSASRPPASVARDADPLLGSPSNQSNPVARDADHLLGSSRNQCNPVARDADSLLGSPSNPGNLVASDAAVPPSLVVHVHRQSLDGRMVRWREVPLSKSALVTMTTASSIVDSDDASSRRSDVPKDCVSPHHRLPLGLRQLASSDGLVAVEVISADSLNDLVLSVRDCRLTERLERLPTSMAAWPADRWCCLAARHVIPGALCVARLGGRHHRARIDRLSPNQQQPPQVRLIDMGGIVTQARVSDLFYLPRQFADDTAPAVLLHAAVANVRLFSAKNGAAAGFMRQLLLKASQGKDGPVTVRLPPGLNREPLDQCRVPVEFVSPPLADQLVKEGFGGSIQDAAFQTLKSDLLAALPPAS
ncbi:hypothetical protein BOX15_Mlig027593g1 [Macrostomum lignano]|uniref:HTH OST-type domain-containing protein n=1 Tax=Macrostomum lignano TaxID=282301 RepID=A0A267F9Z5_9PLAT|nr:hypothetical protein BOX15_Mlig027593g1 [Macrostomum lignano]